MSVDVTPIGGRVIVAYTNSSSKTEQRKHGVRTDIGDDAIGSRVCVRLDDERREYRVYDDGRVFSFKPGSSHGTPIAKDGKVVSLECAVFDGEGGERP